jgi:hypothetical protein
MTACADGKLTAAQKIIIMMQLSNKTLNSPYHQWIPIAAGGGY